jgi:hypothetical protein
MTRQAFVFGCGALSSHDQYRLIEIDVGAGHQPQFVGGEVGRGAGDLVGVDQSTKGLLGGGGVEPSVGGPMIGPHDAILARRRHPADIQPVHADAPGHQAEGGVSRGWRAPLSRRCRR